MGLDAGEREMSRGDFEVCAVRSECFLAAVWWAKLGVVFAD